MSAQIRYRTLVANIGRIYAAPSEQRTSLLQTGLDEIVTVTAPASATGWQTVGADSRRLLRVWAAKETDPAASEVVEQLTDLLTEMAQLTVAEPPPQLVIPPSPPSLMVFEKPAAVPPAAADRIALVPDMVALPAANLISLAQAAALEGSVASSISDAEEEVEEEYIEVEEEEEAAPAPAAAPAKVVEEVEEEVVEEEEVEEEVEEEAEEEGLEVEPISIRGRKYWLGSDQKLYAVIDDDDVGDAVGEMVDGKPRFYAPTK